MIPYDREDFRRVAEAKLRDAFNMLVDLGADHDTAAGVIEQCAKELV